MRLDRVFCDYHFFDGNPNVSLPGIEFTGVAEASGCHKLPSDQGFVLPSGHEFCARAWCPDLHLTVQKSRLWSYQKVIRLSSLIQSKLLEIIVDYIRGEQLPEEFVIMEDMLLFLF